MTEQVNAKVKNHNGSPALFINGAPEFPMIMMSPWGEGESTERGQRRIAGTAKTGIHLYVTQQFVDLAEHTEMWRASGIYVFSGLDAKLDAIVRNDPKACIIIKVYVQAPLWWVRQYPEELVRYADGYEPPDDAAMNVFCAGESGTYASYASVRWKNDAAAMLTAMIGHLEQTEWGRRVIGLNLLNGVCQEWHYWGSVWNHLPDVSTPMKRRFARFLKQKYKTNQALRTAWHDDCANLSDIEMPGIAERDTTRLGYFRDPLAERKIMDYYECQHESTADAIEFFGEAVKKASNNRLLAGVYYGYIFTCPWYVDGISCEVSRVLKSPYIDFLASPATYEDYISRGVGGDSLLRGLPESCRLNGKLYISETDEGAYKCPTVYHECEKSDNFDDSIANIRKQFAQILTRNVGHWWFDLDDEYGLYLHAEHADALTELKRIADASMSHDRAPCGEIALVYSLKSLYCTSHTSTAETYQFLDLTAHLLARCGVRYDIITDNDLFLDGLPEYKLYIFADQFFADSRLTERIMALRGRNGASALWIYGAGFVSEKGVDEAGTENLTGVRVKAEKTAQCHRIILDTAALDQIFGKTDFAGTVKMIHLPSASPDDITRYDADPELVCGTSANLSPTFIVDDDGCVCLGRYQNGGQPAFVVKQAKNGADYYSAAVITSTELLRAIARRAGVHIYNESDDVMMLNRYFICMPVRDNVGDKTITLPETCTVIDTHTGQILCENKNCFTFYAQPNTTYIFEIISE